MKRFILIAAILTSFLWACKSKKEASAGPAPEVPPKPDLGAKGYTPATIVDLTGKLDGCTFLLMLEDSSRLEPTNLDTAFRKDQMKVWVKYGYNHKVMSICMAGKIINISDIVER